MSWNTSPVGRKDHLDRGGVLLPQLEYFLVPFLDFLVHGLVFDLELLEIDQVKPAEGTDKTSRLTPPRLQHSCTGSRNKRKRNSDRVIHAPSQKGRGAIKSCVIYFDKWHTVKITPSSEA